MTDVREALERTSAAISADTAKAKAKNAPATARLVQGGLRCEVTGPYGERLLTDMPPAMGGAASGPNPGWLLRAARLGIALTTLEVVVESESDARGLLGLDDKVSAGLSALRCKVKIGGGADARALKELVQWADEHSPVGCSVRNPLDCSLDVEVV